MKRIMLVCLTALAVSGTYPLYAQSSGSDFMAGDKSLFEDCLLYTSDAADD